MGEFAAFGWLVFRRFATRGCSPRSLSRELHRIGVDSLTVVNLCAFFIGLVMVVQTESMLRRFGAEASVSKVVTSSFVREIGPVFAAIMFAGRVGTGIAAELGSMVVTEQIDAYRVFGADPVARLAVPRVLAATIMLPALTAIADIVGVFAGFLIAVFQLHEPGRLYLDGAANALDHMDIFTSLLKGATFGLLIGLIATNIGFRTARATEAVGTSTTKSMVQAVLAILVADLVITKTVLVFSE